MMSDTPIASQGTWFFLLSSFIICVYAFVRFRQPNPTLEKATGVDDPYRLTTNFGFVVAAFIYVIIFYITCVIPALIPDVLDAVFGVLGNNLDQTFVQWRSYTLMLSLFLILSVLRTRLGEEVDQVLRKVLIQLPIGPTIPDLLAQIRTAPLFLDDPAQIPVFREKTPNSDLLRDPDFDENAEEHKLRWIRLARLDMLLRDMEDNEIFDRFCLARKKRIQRNHTQFTELAGKFKIITEVDNDNIKNDDVYKELVENYRDQFVRQTLKLTTDIYRLFAFASVKFWTETKRVEILKGIGFDVTMHGGPLVEINKLIKALIFVFLVLFLIAPTASPLFVDLLMMGEIGRSGFLETSKVLENFDLFGVWALLVVLIHIPIVMLVVGSKRKVLFDRGQFWSGMRPEKGGRAWSLYLFVSISGAVYGTTIFFFYTVVSYYVDHGDFGKSINDGLPSLMWFFVPAATAASVAYLPDRKAHPMLRWIPDWGIQAAWTMLAAAVSMVLSTIVMTQLGVKPIDRSFSDLTLLVYVFVATGLIGGVIGAIIPKEVRTRQEQYQG